jgi:hypothetical protein
MLAERVLDALIIKREIPAEEAVALAKAARLLQDHGIEWPPLLTQVVHSLADGGATPVQADAPSKALAEAVTGGLSRFFGRARSGSEQP